MPGHSWNWREKKSVSAHKLNLIPLARTDQTLLHEHKRPSIKENLFTTNINCQSKRSGWTEAHPYGRGLFLPKQVVNLKAANGPSVREGLAPPKTVYQSQSSGWTNPLLREKEIHPYDSIEKGEVVTSPFRSAKN
jgi:hypothetical protein